MSDSNLLRGLHQVATPLLAELAARGYQVGLDTSRAQFGVFQFSTTPSIDTVRKE